MGMNTHLSAGDYFQHCHACFRYFDDLVEHMKEKGYTVIKLDLRSSSDYANAQDIRVEWMREQGIHHEDGFHKYHFFFFTHTHDAMLFKLRWG